MAGSAQTDLGKIPAQTGVGEGLTPDQKRAR